MSRTLAILLVAALSSVARASHILPYDPQDVGNWVRIHFDETNPTGVDWFFYNTYNGSQHFLADTDWTYWRLKNTPTPLEPDDTVPLFLLFHDGGVQKTITYSIFGDEQQTNFPAGINVTIGAEVLIPGAGLNQLLPARQATITSDLRGSRSTFGVITVPEPGCVALAFAALAVARRRLK